MLTGTFAVVEVPGDDDGAYRKGNQDIEGWSDALVVGVGPAEDLGNQERTVGGNGGGEACHQ